MHIGIRLQIANGFTAGITYGFGIPGQAPWTDSYIEQINTTGQGIAYDLILRNDSNVFQIVPYKQINGGDAIRADFFAIRKAS